MEVKIWIKGEIFANDAVTRQSGEGSFELHRDSDTITVESGNFSISMNSAEFRKLMKLGKELLK